MLLTPWMFAGDTLQIDPRINISGRDVDWESVMQLWSDLVGNELHGATQPPPTRPSVNPHHCLAQIKLFEAYIIQSVTLPTSHRRLHDPPWFLLKGWLTTQSQEFGVQGFVL
jgi:hypothetical protein